MNTKTADEVIQDIVEVLTNTDASFIEKIANQVLTKPVKFVGSSSDDYDMFETESE